MKTYKYFIIVTIFILSLGCFSCNDNNFLKENPESSYMITNAFTIQSQVKDCVAQIQADYSLFRYGGNINRNLLWGGGTDIIDSPNNASGYSSFNFWNTQYVQVEYVFNYYYQIIAQANFALLGASEVKWEDEELHKACVGEAKFFRGLCYLGLGELFGGVPINLEYVEKPVFNYKRSTREETYNVAITDLENAVSLLEKHPGAGHPGKGMCETALTEAYIALATIKNNDAALLQKAIDYASDCMTFHSLMTKRFGTRANPKDNGSYNNIPNYYPQGNVYWDLFQRGNLDYEEGNTESLWVKECDYETWVKYLKKSSTNLLCGNNTPRTAGPVLRNLRWRPEYLKKGAANGPFNVTTFDEFKLQKTTSAYVGGRTVYSSIFTNFVNDDLWKNDESDIRGQYPVLRRNIKVQDPKHPLYGTELNVSNIKKYITDETLYIFSAICSKTNPIDDWGYQGLAEGVNNRTWTYNDMYFYRLAETYLLRAEAYYRMGNLPAAAADINALRIRAQAKPISESDVNLDLILDERARELLYEELRWNTLLRMGGDIPNERIMAHGRFTHDITNSSGSFHGSLRNDFLFPIPQSFIDSNTEATIEQNPGWE